MSAGASAGNPVRVAARPRPGAPGGVWLLVAALILSNGLLIWKVRSQAGQIARIFPKISRMGLYALVENPFPLAAGGSVTLGMVPQHYLVIFVFTRYDAPFYTSELEALGNLARARHDIRVFGIMAFASVREARAFGAREGLSFPVLADPVGNRLQAISPPRTPWLYVLDVRHKHLMFGEPPLGRVATGGRS